MSQPLLSHSSNNNNTNPILQSSQISNNSPSLPPTRSLSRRTSNSRVQQQAHNIRLNVLNQLRNVRFSQIAACMSLLMNLPQIVAIAVIVGTDIDPRVCDRPLQYWLIIYATRLLLTTVLTLIPACNENVSTVSSSYARLVDSVNLFGLCWLVVGTLWTSGSHSCASAIPQVYQLTVLILIINYIAALLPCLLLICLLPFVFFCLPALLRLTALLPQPQVGATDEQIDSVPSFEYNSRDFQQRYGEQGECAICLQAYEDGEWIKQLPCGAIPHHFHAKCAHDWLKINNSCPICRQAIPEQYSSTTQRSQERNLSQPERIV